MNLIQTLRLSQATIPKFKLPITFVGAGGKTTALFQLAHELTTNEGKNQGRTDPGRPVIISATTHLHTNQISLADSHLIVEKQEDFIRLDENLRGIILVTGPLSGNRTTGLKDDLLQWLREFCLLHDLPLLIEADGSRQRPLKAPANHEPVIPGWAETVVVVTGLAGLGKPLTEQFVHRPEIFSRLSGLKMGQTITPENLVHELTNLKGGLKNIPVQARRIALLNQADSHELQAQAKWMAAQLLSCYHAIIIASLNPKSAVRNFQSTIHAVYEPVAGIILAGGGSFRYGRPKSMLTWHGKPFIRTVAETALEAGLSPIVVVTGANAEQVEPVVKDLPVKIVRNVDWQNGQSSSIYAGLRDLALLQPPSHLHSHPIPSIHGTLQNSSLLGGEWKRTGAAIFLLTDQPQITSTVIRALCEEHARTLAPIIAPLVDGQRANPVLFDWVTFPDLLALSGDTGGRALFSKFPVNFLPWHDASILSDVDTPEEYEKLINGG